MFKFSKLLFLLVSFTSRKPTYYHIIRDDLVFSQFIACLLLLLLFVHTHFPIFISFKCYPFSSVLFHNFLVQLATFNLLLSSIHVSISSLVFPFSLLTLQGHLLPQPFTAAHLDICYSFPSCFSKSSLSEIQTD